MTKAIFSLRISAMAAAAVLAAGPNVRADEQLTLFNALDLIARDQGDRFIDRIVVAQGTYGQPQPEEWTVQAYDPQSPQMVRHFWAGEDEVTDEGPADDIYPHHPPAGVIDSGRLRLDSKDAFVAADQLASAAGVGFDSLSYMLRARELSSEPIWQVTLMDEDHRIVGIVTLSGDTGDPLRTIWIGRSDPPAGAPRIEDSLLLPGAIGTVTIEPASPGRFLEPDDPNPPGDPIAPAEPAPARPFGGPDPGNEVPDVVPLENGD